MPAIAENRRAPGTVRESSDGPPISTRGLCRQELLPGSGVRVDAHRAPVPDFRPELSLRRFALERQRFVVLALLLGGDGHRCDGVMPQLELLPVRRPGIVDLTRQSLALFGSPRARGAERVLILEPEPIIPRLYGPLHVGIHLIVRYLG